MDDIRRCVGISLTATKLQFIEIEKDFNTLQAVNFGQTFLSQSLNFELHDEKIIQDQLQSAYDEIKIRNPVTSSTASFALPPELFITIQLPFDSNLNQNEIREEFNWELSQLYPFMNVDELALKFYELDNIFSTVRNNALIVALNKKYLIMIKDFCHKNNLTPKLVDNSSITANTFINNQMKGKKSNTGINIFNSKNLFTLFININSKPVYVKVFNKHFREWMETFRNEISANKIKEVLIDPLINTTVSGEELETEIHSELEKSTSKVFGKFDPFDFIKLKRETDDQLISPEENMCFTSAAGIASRFN